MARAKKKAGEAGAAKNFITRNQALKKLQLSLPDFRKLCIWKGIYPREPRSRKRANKSATASTTFYYAKDIQYLLHEPLIEKFRDQKVLEKKITRALGRGDVRGAKRLDDNAQRPATTGKPVYTLDHVVRERYPTFVDALRDLDDCLSMLFLFANLPSTASVPARMVARCERLCLEFQHYLIVSRSLRKSFLSIKGIYYQANIQGEDILWLVPYKFNQRIVGDIDFRIMGTFVEFYMTLLGFVNFRLYTSINLKYPPKFDKTLDDQSAELGAFLLEGKNLLNGDETKQITENGEQDVDPKTQAAVQQVIEDLKHGEGQDDVEKAVVPVDADEEPQPTETLDKFEPMAANGDILPQPEYSSADPGSLFANFTFFLSRETPRQPLEFLLKAFGCKRVGWDPVLGEGAYTTNELDPSITHQIVDRPPIIVSNEPNGDGEDNQTAQKLGPNKRVPGRIYVQPQWVWDSVNEEELKRPDLYAPGASLPPHLSPFVKNIQGQYDPTIPLEEQEPEGEALELDSEEEEDEDMEEVVANGDNAFAVQAIDETVEGMDVAGSEEDEEDDDDQAAGASDFGGFSDEEREIEEASDDDEALQRQRELEAELRGTTVMEAKLDPRAKAKADAKKAMAKKSRDEAEELERAKGMLPKKKRKLYEKMIYSNTKKSAGDEKLRAKRRKLEKQKGKASA